MDKPQNPPHIPMDSSSITPTQVLGQTSTTVSLDTDTLIAARQGAPWKISGWPENIAIHHAKGCACCHEYINHLLGAQSLRQINLQHIDVENAVHSAWPTFINSIEINADQHVQGQFSDLHGQINELKNALHDVKKSHRNTEAALTKEHSCIKDLELSLKDLRSHSQSEVNASALPPMTLATAEPTPRVVAPTWSLPQPEAGPSRLASARGQALLPTLVLKRDETCLSTQGSQPQESHCHGGGQ